MQFRTAQIHDIPQIQSVRHAVKENVLSDPALVTDADCADYLTRRGKGWVCETNGQIVGFAIADLQEHNIWALFVLPEYESQGVGRRLHDLMLDWYFQQTRQTVWLGTAPGTRAEGFYTRAGWTRVGMVNKGEVKFEMSAENWRRLPGL
jgi:GNAT superfamily N-acetyltransferase